MNKSCQILQNPAYLSETVRKETKKYPDLHGFCFCICAKSRFSGIPPENIPFFPEKNHFLLAKSPKAWYNNHICGFYAG